MARRRTSISISLFPFLSILSCVIGTMTLLITGQVVGGSGTGSPGDEAPESESLAVEPEPSFPNDDLGDEVRPAMGGADVLWGHESPGAAEDLGGSEAIGGEPIPAVSEPLGSSKVGGRRSSLGEGELPPRPVGAGLRLPLIVDYLDRKDAERFPPSFVMCDEQGVVLDVAESEGPPERVPSNVIGSSPELADYLVRHGTGTKGIVVFLIRPGGVGAFERAQEVAHREHVRYGQLPVPEGRALDFSRLEAPPPARPVPAEEGR